MKPDWSLASVEEARAYWYAGNLMIQITGRAPTPCYSVGIERNLLQVDPPEFIARWYQHSPFCPEVLTPYERQEIFPLGEKPRIVNLYRAEGVLDILVQDRAHLVGELATAAPREGSTDPKRPESEFSDKPQQPESVIVEPLEDVGTTGHYRALSFAEAFRNAIDNLSDDPEPVFPDQLTVYELVAFGGIAGFNDTYVEARRRDLGE